MWIFLRSKAETTPSARDGVVILISVEPFEVADTAPAKCACDPVFRFSSLHSNAMVMMSDAGPYPESPFLAFLLSPPSSVPHLPGTAYLPVFNCVLIYM